MKSVVVEVRNGLITGIYSNAEDTHFLVVDWDMRTSFEEPVIPGVTWEASGLDCMPSDTRVVHNLARA